MALTIEEWYRQMPVVTRTYLTLAFLTTAGCALEIISPFTVYFNPRLIFRKAELWRLLTNFMFFGSLGLDFLFHMFFLARYSRLLEEGSFRGRTADFLYMLLFGARAGGTILTMIAPFVNIQFLGSSLTFMMGRRNEYVNMSFLGLFNFSAPFLPWVLLAFSTLLGSSPLVDMLGIGAGHVYYFLEDVYPRMTGRRVLRTPGLIRALFPGDDGSGFVAARGAALRAGLGNGAARGGGGGGAGGFFDPVGGRGAGGDDNGEGRADDD